MTSHLAGTKARATFNGSPRYRIGFFRKSIEDPTRAVAAVSTN
ncbi:hypothetical protein [Brucella intermedia]|nr:hypothetical protein [Brucella intermedia]